MVAAQGRLDISTAPTQNAATMPRATKTKTSEFVEHLLDLLEPMGGVSARAMFGGWGFYYGGKMFTLVAMETFYVKADAANLAEFEALDLAPFTYPGKNGECTVMSYRTVPPAALESSPALIEWARKGIKAAERAVKKKRESSRRL